jgi:two-component system nitrogen regulation sensor histidine kinase NtrY
VFGSKTYSLRFLLAGLAVIFLSSVFRAPADTNYSAEIKKFEYTLHNKEIQLENEVNALTERAAKKSYTELFSEKPAHYERLYKEFGYVLLIYENDTLQFWSDNSAAVENQMKTICLDDKLVKLRNGWFEVIRAKSPQSTRNCIGLLLIKNDFPYQNSYLLNDFQKQFSLPEDTRIQKGSRSDTFAIHDREGDYLFSLKFSENTEQTSSRRIWSAIIAFTGIVLLLIGFFALFNNVFNKNYLKTVFFLLSLIIFRFITIKFHWPVALYSASLFGPQYYGDATSFWLPSMGDLLLNTLFLLCIGLFFNFTETNFLLYFQITKLRLTARLLLLTGLLLSLFSCSLIINKFFISLIQNSTISFTINNIFSLNSLSYAGFIIIAIIQLAFFLCADKVIRIICSLQLPSRSLLNPFLISVILFSVLCHLTGYVDWVFIAMPVVITICIYIIRRRVLPVYSFPDIVVIVILFSIYSVYTFTKEGRAKEHRERVVIAQKLTDDQDPLTEHLFSEVETKFNSDSLLMGYLIQPVKNVNAFEKRLRQDYFSGYWDKYNIKLSLYDTSCNALFRPIRPAGDNSAYYDEMIELHGQPTTCEHFYFLKNNSGKISYVAKLPIYGFKHGQHLLATLYAVLNTRFLPEETGFPELLLDRNMGIDKDLFNYSYAKYKNNELISQYGKFQYSLKPAQFIGNKEEFTFTDIDGYTHLSYSPNKSTVVVISKLSHTLLDAVTYFSYLFSFFSLIVLIAIIIRQMIRGSLFNQSSFKYRIQFLLVLIVLISLALFGTGTIFYIKQQYEAKNRESISEKINSVAIDLENQLEGESILNEGYKENSNYLLRKLSSVFFTDINIYDLKGNVYTSSQPKIFEEGLASKKMNPEAYLQMAIGQKTQYIHDEEIGNLEYLSAYVPFKGKNGQLLAYLNLPYFAKQTELEKEIAGFLVALINIYVLLFALSVIMAIFISNYVTRPLKLVQDKLSKIQLGKRNEPIEWADNDEIGNLVKEYNRMIEELTHSADLLAKSERESAWREMARQVAHEIKNPLTPMKLSVQHLQRIMHDKTPNMEQRLQSITNTLIEQIDALSSIASAFSSFAKMPRPNNEKIDLDIILQNTITLFKEIAGSVIYYSNNTSSEAFIYGDKEQLLRVFNNLLKNAIQAIPETREGRITVSLDFSNNYYIVTLKDNGTGISKDAINKIFTPNFTTKSTGMGLGLAMAKSTIESCEGKISFKTEEGKGTEFYVSIPSYKE